MFRCETNVSVANKFNNYLDLKNTLRAMPLALSENVLDEEGDAMQEFIEAMILNI